VVLSAVNGVACTQLELGQAVGIDKSTLVVTLDELERRRLVHRRPAPADRRRRVIEITRAGRSALRDVGLLVREVEGEVLGALTADERRMLLELLGRIVASGVADTPAQGSCV
jgi:DNA-binding MarR family transcriptional regulator